MAYLNVFEFNISQQALTQHILTYLSDPFFKAGEKGTIRRMPLRALAVEVRRFVGSWRWVNPWWWWWWWWWRWWWRRLMSPLTLFSNRAFTILFLLTVVDLSCGQVVLPTQRKTDENRTFASRMMWKGVCLKKMQDPKTKKHRDVTVAVHVFVFSVTLMI